MNNEILVVIDNSRHSDWAVARVPGGRRPPSDECGGMQVYAAPPRDRRFGGASRPAGKVTAS